MKETKEVDQAQTKTKTKACTQTTNQDQITLYLPEFTTQGVPCSLWCQQITFWTTKIAVQNLINYQKKDPILDAFKDANDKTDLEILLSDDNKKRKSSCVGEEQFGYK